MKLYLPVACIIIVFSSCLKESIPDAMLAAKNASILTATMSYKVNGTPVNISLQYPEQQDPASYIYTLACLKSDYYYSLAGKSNTGEISFNFYTDSLAAGHYSYNSAYGLTFGLTYNETFAYVYAAPDSMSINITSYKDGFIDGSFSGALSPMTAGGASPVGDAGSIIITDGSFKNVPVFY